MINRFILFFVITLFAYNIALSQSETIDSLKNIVSEGDDTTKLKAYIDISKEYMDTDIEKAKTYNKTIDSLKKLSIIRNLMLKLYSIMVISILKQENTIKL